MAYARYSSGQRPFHSLNPLNQSTPPNFRADAKFIGAVLGVSLGCVLGMAPLAFMDPGFFTPPADANTAKTDD